MPFTREAHISRAERHIEVAEVLADAGHEWAAVPYFYGAYHLARAAILVHPAFTDPTALAQVHPNLQMSDRAVERHKGRKERGGAFREFGVNDLMLLLFRPVAGKYARLHQASIEVRYGEGLQIPIPAIQSAIVGLREGLPSHALRA